MMDPELDADNPLLKKEQDAQVSIINYPHVRTKCTYFYKKIEHALWMSILLVLLLLSLRFYVTS